MDPVSDHLSKVRAERIAREKARIENLRQLNLKKYSSSTTELAVKPSSSQAAPKKLDTTSSVHTLNKPVQSKINFLSRNIKSTSGHQQKVNNIRKKETISSVAGKQSDNQIKKKEIHSIKKPTTPKVPSKSQIDIKSNSFIEKNIHYNASKNAKGDAKAPAFIVDRKIENGPSKIEAKPVRKSYLPKFEVPKSKSQVNLKPQDVRKSIQPVTRPHSTNEPSRLSVFERLYQPKIRNEKKNVTDAEKIKNDPNFFKRTINDANFLLNKRHTVFETKETVKEASRPRRSISAVHFKRINKNELSNCIIKWSSIGDKLDKVHLENITEDAAVKEDKIVSAVKSDRKRVKFQTPVFNFNTPKPEELQSRLQHWLEKRGKSMNSYQHLQCFGIHHLSQMEIKPLNLEPKLEEFDDDNKENEPLASDSDNDSYEDTMNRIKESRDENLDAPIDQKDCLPVPVDSPKTNWRRASYISDCVTDMNETQNSILSSMETPHLTRNHASPQVDELLLGALKDLTELLKEGFDWEQCARWLRLIREKFPSAPTTAAYWECRAALEERRGNLTGSVQCWENAIAQGTEHSVVEANLDQLLDKFMQLHIDPQSGRRRQPPSKLVDVKNVFKSTLIRFAVQQARIRETQEAKFTVTPVRRSGRLSAHWSSRRTPLQECASVQQAGLLLQQPLLFVPNDKLTDTP